MFRRSAPFQRWPLGDQDPPRSRQVAGGWGIFLHRSMWRQQFASQPDLVGDGVNGRIIPISVNLFATPADKVVGGF
jgi:hypothetical protein